MSLVETEVSVRGSTGSNLAGVDLALIQSVQGVCRDPKFAEAAILGDRDAAEPLESVRALGALGLNRAAVPASHGGGGMNGITMSLLMEEIASADASVAVVWNMHLSAMMYLSLFPTFPRLEAALEDMRDSDRMLCGGFSAPLAQLDARKAGFVFTEDGDSFVVTGRGGFATGSDGATYYFLLGRRDPMPEERVSVFAVARVDEPGIQVQGNWDAMGLRGTASHDVVVDGWRVKKDEVLELPAGLFSKIADFVPRELAYILQMPNIGLMSGMVGICSALFEALTSHLERRFGRTTAEMDSGAATAAATQAWAHHRLGHLDHTLAATRTMVREYARLIDEGNLARTLVQAKSCVETFVVGTCHLGGAHGYAAASPLNRLVRDALGYNAMVWRLDELAISLGRAAFGEEIRVPGVGGT
jgi:alkylation response protein AidB-like acyl-CoA dehydrogenase